MQYDSDGNERPDPAFVLRGTVAGKAVAVEVSHHAGDRMRQRGIEADAVLLCLTLPDDRNLPADPPRLRHARLERDGRRTNVVFERIDWDTDAPVIVVISVFRTSR